MSPPVLPPSTAEAGGFQIVPLTTDANRTATAVWECVKSDPAVNEGLRFGIVIAYRRSSPTPTLGTTSVNGKLGADGSANRAATPGTAYAALPRRFNPGACLHGHAVKQHERGAQYFRVPGA